MPFVDACRASRRRPVFLPEPAGFEINGTAYRSSTDDFVPVLLGVLLIGFLLLQVVPTDPATVVAGPTATKAEIDAIRNDLGLNQPLWVQFGRYLGRVFQLDLGRSMISNRAVVDEIALTLWPTVE